MQFHIKRCSDERWYIVFTFDLFAPSAPRPPRATLQTLFILSWAVVSCFFFSSFLFSCELEHQVFNFKFRFFSSTKKHNNSSRNEMISCVRCCCFCSRGSRLPVENFQFFIFPSSLFLLGCWWCDRNRFVKTTSNNTQSCSREKSSHILGTSSKLFGCCCCQPLSDCWAALSVWREPSQANSRDSSRPAEDLIWFPWFHYRWSTAQHHRTEFMADARDAIHTANFKEVNEEAK